MTDPAVEVEQLRAEATAWLQANGPGNLAMRSCWNCNGAHEHLRDADFPFWCFDCGRYFYKGVDITEDDGQGPDDN